MKPKTYPCVNGFRLLSVMPFTCKHKLTYPFVKGFRLVNYIHTCCRRYSRQGSSNLIVHFNCSNKRKTFCSLWTSTLYMYISTIQHVSGQGNFYLAIAGKYTRRSCINKHYINFLRTYQYHAVVKHIQLVHQVELS